MKSLKKQGGFTLLELLVVVGLMAAVAVVAVSTYDDADASASIATDLSNIQAIDQGIRSYAGQNNGNFPEQLDSLLTKEGTPYVLLADETQAALQALPVTGVIGGAILEALEENGMEEFQFITKAANDTPEVAFFKKDPNAQHAEASGNGVELPVATNAKALTIVANNFAATGSNTDACKVDGTDYALAATKTLDGAVISATKNNVLNAINDQFESDICNVVVALGVGGDAAANSEGTFGATSSDAVKDKAGNYSRYLALFHVAQDGIATGVKNGAIDDKEVFAKPRFIGVINPLGQGTNELNKLKNTQ
jgi:prepilin-type N-terminal cleavage/methylation domain-containing protein